MRRLTEEVLTMIKMTVLSSREEWLEHRKKYIGGSDISAVIGCNPYMTNQDLWEIKTGKRIPEDISDKPFIQYGNQAEGLLRDLFQLDFPQYKVEYVENNSYTNNKYPWAAASLDGKLTDEEGRTGILEIKTTNILQSMQKEKWHNAIPQNYYCQVLLYMAVLEADFAILKAQLKSVIDGIPYLQTKHYYIERESVQEDIDYLMAEGAKFWEYIKNDRKPALLLPEI